jgi:hypothetical protein
MDQQSENEWIEWAGGECPVPYETPVEVKLRGEREPEEVCPAGDYCGSEPHTSYNTNWLHDGGGLDIIAYRVVQS